MSRIGGKLRHHVQGRQKMRLNVIVICATCGAAIILALIALFNFTSLHRAKAREIEIRRAEEQVFINDMSLPAPFINSESKGTPNTIFIQQIKPVQEESAK